MQTAEKAAEFRQNWRPTQQKVDLAVKAAIDIAQPSRVFIFGSWARGEATDSSDLDLAVLVPDERKGEIPDLRRKIIREYEGLCMSIDLVLVTEGYFARFLASVNSIYYKISNQGKLVYEQRD